MKNETEFECYGCGNKTLDVAPFPFLWNRIKIFGEVQHFCPHCSAHFKHHPGGDHPWDISPYMKEVLQKRHGLVFED